MPIHLISVMLIQCFHQEFYSNAETLALTPTRFIAMVRLSVCVRYEHLPFSSHCFRSHSRYILSRQNRLGSTKNCCLCISRVAFNTLIRPDTTAASVISLVGWPKLVNFFFFFWQCQGIRCLCLRPQAAVLVVGAMQPVALSGNLAATAQNSS